MADDPLTTAMNMTRQHEPQSMGRSNAAQPKTGIRTSSGTPLMKDPKMHQFGRDRGPNARPKPTTNMGGYPASEPSSLSKAPPSVPRPPSPTLAPPSPSPLPPGLPLHAPEMAAELAAADAEAGPLVRPKPGGMGPGMAGRALSAVSKAMPIANLAHTVGSFGGDAVDNMAELAGGHPLPGRPVNDSNFLGIAPVGPMIDHLATMYTGHPDSYDGPVRFPRHVAPWAPAPEPPPVGRNPFQFGPPSEQPMPRPSIEEALAAIARGAPGWTGPPQSNVNPVGPGRNPFLLATEVEK